MAVRHWEAPEKKLNTQYPKANGTKNRGEDTLQRTNSDCIRTAIKPPWHFRIALEDRRNNEGLILHVQTDVEGQISHFRTDLEVQILHFRTDLGECFSNFRTNLDDWTRALPRATALFNYRPRIGDSLRS